MVVKGEAIVVILDVGNSMHYDESYPTPLDESKKIISRIIQRKIFSESKDEIALVLCGYADKIPLDEDKKDVKYANICIAQNLQRASWKLHEIVNDIEGTDVIVESMRDLALETAINLLQNSVNAKKIDSQRILFFTNFDGYFKNPDINMVFDQLKSDNIDINFIGPLAITEDMKLPGEKYNELIDCHISDLFRDVNGESFSFSDVLSALTNYQMKTVQPTPTNITLNIGTLSIPISVFIKVSENKAKTWKTACTHDLTKKPRKITTFCMNDEAQTKVSHEDLIQAFKYGTTLVPYSEDDKKNMDYQPGERGMTVLGFTKAEKIPRHLYNGDKSRYVFPQKNNDSAGEALSAFIQSLEDVNKVAIVRFVSTARSAPSIGFLSPKIKENYECLVFVALPFMEDLRHLVFTPLDSDTKNVPTEEQLSAVDELISAMDMTASHEDDELEEEILKPKNTANPYVQRMFQCLAYKALHPEKPLPDVPPHIQTLLNPTPKLLNRAEPSIQKIKSLFPLKEYIPKKTNDTNFQLFSNSNLDKSIKSEPSSEDIPEAKFDVTETKLVDVMVDKITQVGSINPVRDIQYLINNQILPFNKICEQINDVLSQLLQESDRLRFSFPKILSICKEYRASSLKESDCENYNLFMISLRKNLLETNEELWDKISNERITFISKEELPTSTVSSEEAERFLSKPCLVESARDTGENMMSSAMEDDDDEDDLMDQL